MFGISFSNIFYFYFIHFNFKMRKQEVYTLKEILFFVFAGISHFKENTVQSSYSSTNLVLVETIL